MKTKKIWNGMPFPWKLCGYHKYEETGPGGGKNHVCTLDDGHEGHHECDCGTKWKGGNPPLIVEV